MLFNRLNKDSYCYNISITMSDYTNGHYINISYFAASFSKMLHLT